MKDLKWVWISYFCLVAWIVILLWIDKALSVHAQEGNGEVSEELEEEMYYDSLKRMVVDVILNRVDHPDWPDSITGVITDPYEFASYWDGGMDSVWEPSEETFQAVKMELESRSWPGLYYFTSNGWSKYGVPWKKVGDHYFSR